MLTQGQGTDMRFLVASCPTRKIKPVRVAILWILLLAYWYTAQLKASQTHTETQATVAPAASKKIVRILLVSALFPLEHSKHSHDEYRSWLANFLGPTGIACDVYFYTTPALEPTLRSLHASSNQTHKLVIDTSFDTPFAVPPLTQHREKYTQMHAWDRERDIHNPELYAVWNAKPWLLAEALRSLRDPRTWAGSQRDYEYDYAFWNDAGSFREAHGFGVWPDPERVADVFAAAGKGVDNGGKDLVFFPLLKNPGEDEFGWTPDKGPVDMDFSEGEHIFFYSADFDVRSRLHAILSTAFACSNGLPRSEKRLV